MNWFKKKIKAYGNAGFKVTFSCMGNQATIPLKNNRYSPYGFPIFSLSIIIYGGCPAWHLSDYFQYLVVQILYATASQDFGFTGHLYVLNDSTYAVKRCKMNLPKKTGVNFVENLSIIQEYEPLPSGNWALAKDDMIAELYLVKALQGVQVRRTTVYSDYSFEELPAKLFKPRGEVIKEPDAMMKDEKLLISPLAYIRGRSLGKVFFIIDEAQNLTPHEIKTIITRAGEGTKMIFTGDIFQIDQPYLDIYSNGLTHLGEKMSGQPLFAHIDLKKGERSELSEIASKLL